MISIWEELGIAQTTDVRAVKRAYSVRLKNTRPEENPEGFQRLRDAYDLALRQAEMAQHQAGEGQGQAAPEASVHPSPLAPNATRLAPIVVNALDEHGRIVRTQISAPEPAAALPSTQEREARDKLALEQVRARAQQLVTEFVAGLQERFAYVNGKKAHWQKQLGTFIRQDIFFELLLREQFELCMAEYCVTQPTAPELMMAARDEFGWNLPDHPYHRAYPKLSHDLVMHMRAIEQYTYLQERAAAAPMVKSLIDKKMPERRIFPFPRKAVHDGMRNFFLMLQQQMPELWQLRIDQNWLAAWQCEFSRRTIYHEDLWRALGIFLFLMMAFRCGSTRNSVINNFMLSHDIQGSIVLMMLGVIVLLGLVIIRYAMPTLLTEKIRLVRTSRYGVAGWITLAILSQGFAATTTKFSVSAMVISIVLVSLTLIWKFLNLEEQIRIFAVRKHGFLMFILYIFYVTLISIAPMVRDEQADPLLNFLNINLLLIFIYSAQKEIATIKILPESTTKILARIWFALTLAVAVGSIELSFPNHIVSSIYIGFFAILVYSGMCLVRIENLLILFVVGVAPNCIFMMISDADLFDKNLPNDHLSTLISLALVTAALLSEHIKKLVRAFRI